MAFIACLGRSFKQSFSLLRDVLVAAALSARDRAVAPFNGGSHHAAALSWADGDAAWTNADGGVIAPTIPIVAIGAVPPDLNIDALRHLEALGLGRSGRLSVVSTRCDCRQDESEHQDAPSPRDSWTEGTPHFHSACYEGALSGVGGLAGEPSHTNNAWRR
jgi:hypothetical protein